MAAAMTNIKKAEVSIWLKTPSLSTASPAREAITAPKRCYYFRKRTEMLEHATAALVSARGQSGSTVALKHLNEWGPEHVVTCY